VAGFIKSFLVASFLIILSGCASRMNPEGGKKDITPPVLKESMPDNQSINFKEKKIELIFDEYVQLADLNNQLVVSPLMEPMPKITAYKNRITIELPDTLLPNTTYSINFGKSIVDVHELNVLEEFRYVFSTGSVIDSLTMSGMVREAATMKGMKGVTVMLYRSSSIADTTLLKRKPDYTTRTDETGNYLLTNLSAGDYVLMALEDKNGNYQYDDPAEEALAFTGKVLVLPPSLVQQLDMSLSLPAKLRLKRANRIGKTIAQLVFNRPVKDLNITIPGGADYAGTKIWNTRKDTLCLFMPDTLQDSLIVYLKGESSLVDTLALKMLPSKSSRETVYKGLSLSIAVSPQISGVNSSFTIQSLTPMLLPASLKVYEDSVMLNEATITMDKDDARRFSINYNWKPGKSYRVPVVPGMLKDVYGYTNDSLEWQFRILDERSSGELLVKVNGKKTEEHAFFLQLCTEDFKVVRQQRIITPELSFSYVMPGTYRLRIFRDDNRNERLDESDYAENRQAEIISITEPFQVRASWTLEKEIVFPK
jgi:uncharacterized protein (DUF2141 family)